MAGGMLLSSSVLKSPEPYTILPPTMVRSDVRNEISSSAQAKKSLLGTTRSAN
ncbi:hypothetical protein D3C72_2545570 [compost metagenome]